jgi:hypothetical protein
MAAFRNAELHDLANIYTRKKTTQPANTGRQDYAINQSRKKDTILEAFTVLRHYDPGMRRRVVWYVVITRVHPKH